MAYIHERPGWPEFTWDTRGPGGGPGRGAPQARQAPREDGGPRIRSPRGGEPGRAHGRSREVLGHRGGAPEPGGGPFVDRPQARTRRRGPSPARPGRRRRRRDDARRDAQLRRRRSRRSVSSVGTRRSFPTGRSGMHRITVGAWRTGDAGPMQVVSGPMGRERVHFEAPERGAPRDRDEAVPRVVQRAVRRRSGAEGRRGALLVRHDPSVRRRQRPDRAGDRRHGALAGGRARRTASTACPPESKGSGRSTTESSNPRSAVTSTSRVARVVSRVSRSRHRGRRQDARLGAPQGEALAADPAAPSTNGSEESSIGCSTTSRGT